MKSYNMEFCVWFILISIVFSRFMHAVACISAIPFYGQVILGCIDTRYLMSHLPIDGHLGYF